jgi:hypothetical protein
MRAFVYVFPPLFSIVAAIFEATKNLPRPSSLQLGIEISGKTMGARCLMGMLPLAHNVTET